MPLLLVALSIGFVARQLRAPSAVPLVFQRFWLLGVAAGLQVGLVPALQGSLRSVVLFLTLAGAVWWLISNIVWTNNKTLRWALLVIAAGAIMNVIATLAHGAMPVDAGALRSLGATEPLNPSRAGAKHIVVNAGSTQFFGDRFPIRPLRCVVSIGDFVEMFGIALLITAIPKRVGTPAVSRAPYGPLTT
jgi:Family of unknown function (DUF5317)